MTKLHIPTIGDRMKLLAPWSFDIMDEHRNDGFFEVCGFLDPGTECHNIITEVQNRYDFRDVRTLRDAVWAADYYGRGGDRRVPPSRVWADDIINRSKVITFEFTLPEGTVLILDRIYIRKSMGKFDSVTFMVESAPDGTFKNPPPKKNLAFGRKPRFWVKLDDANKMDVDFL